MTTEEPLCVKCILYYSQKNKSNEIVSLNEFKNKLFESINQKQEFLKGNFEKVEQMKMKQQDNKEIESLKQKGL